MDGIGNAAINHHTSPSFDGEKGIEEAKQWADSFIQGTKAIMEETEGHNTEQRKQLKRYIAEFKILIREMEID